MSDLEIPREYRGWWRITSTSQSRSVCILSRSPCAVSGHFWEPLREIERIAVEALPDFKQFLCEWRALIEDCARKERHSDWGSDVDRWRREVVQRLEGAEGLARVARSTTRADDLRVWCEALVAAKDWKQALSAYEEAAEIVSDTQHSRGEFFDGTALAAQELGRQDLPTRLERAWRAAPSVVRLGRWIGSATGKTALRDRATTALDACPEQAVRQRALLHVLLDDVDAAAKLMASAPGLGWSGGEHPGPLLFSLFSSLLTGTRLDTVSGRDSEDVGATPDPDAARLVTRRLHHSSSLPASPYPKTERAAWRC